MRSSIPVRSISLPSRLHPSTLKLQTELDKMRKWVLLSPSSSAIPLESETIQIGLTRLVDLYNCMEELIHSPLTQQALHKHQHSSLVEEALDVSVGLLDVCGTTRDIILTMKEQVQDLQSALRRRGQDVSIEDNIKVYVVFRKKLKKDIAKCLRTLKKIQSKVQFFSLSQVSHQHLAMVVDVLEESSTITISILRSLLLFVSMPVMKTKADKLSFMSRLIPLASGRGQKIFNDVGIVNFVLQSLHGKIRKNNAKFDVQLVQRRLGTLEGSIGVIDEGLDSLFRCLIQNRVSLLNILTP